jgi:hypothetical protein
MEELMAQEDDDGEGGFAVPDANSKMVMCTPSYNVNSNIYYVHFIYREQIKHLI